MFIQRGLYSSAPPQPRTKFQNNPTLLFSWWCTGCAVTVILFRLSGRKIRNARLFREDKIMALSLIPLLIRMALIHPVLLWGNNNVDTAGLSAQSIYHRSIGSKLVLGARIFYALFIWISKFTVSEYLKRLFSNFWTKGDEMALRAIRIFLAVSFIAVVIATLAECHPVDHYWQVVPDPGPQCRQAYAQLITMGVADIITDVLLILFPLPMVWKSHFQLTTKIRLFLLFSLSIILIVITAYRVPSVIAHRSLQQYRTVWASGEILGAAAVSNAIVLGSFLRDRGLKKGKYKSDRYGSTTDSMSAPSTRRQTIAQHTLGSDEDLFRGMCYRTEHEDEESGIPRAPPIADPPPSQPTDMSALRDPKWNFPESIEESNRDSEDSDLKKSIAVDAIPSPRTNDGQPRERRVSFFDVGGLLGEDGSSHSTLVPSRSNSSVPHDVGSSRRPSLRFSDIGNLLSSSKSSNHRPSRDENAIELTQSLSNRSQDPPRSILRRSGTEVTLRDPGGLLTPTEEVPEESQHEYLNSSNRNGDPFLSPLTSPNFSYPQPHISRSSSLRRDRDPSPSSPR